MLLVAVHLQLLDQREQGLEAAARTHVADAVEDLLARTARLLHAELVAGKTNDGEVSVLEPLLECIQFPVGPSETSVGGHVHQEQYVTAVLVQAQVAAAGDFGEFEVVQ